MAEASAIPTPRTVAIALNRMLGYPAIIKPFLPFVLSPTPGASVADKAALADLAAAYLPGDAASNAEERAFAVARLIVTELTPSRIGAPGDDEPALQAAWVAVQRGAGYYSGTNPVHPTQVSGRLIGLYRARTGDQSALVPPAVSY